MTWCVDCWVKDHRRIDAAGKDDTGFDACAMHGGQAKVSPAHGAQREAATPTHSGSGSETKQGKKDPTARASKSDGHFALQGPEAEERRQLQTADHLRNRNAKRESGPPADSSSLTRSTTPTNGTDGVVGPIQDPGARVVAPEAAPVLGRAGAAHESKEKPMADKPLCIVAECNVPVKTTKYNGRCSMHWYVPKTGLRLKDGSKLLPDGQVKSEAVKAEPERIVVGSGLRIPLEVYGVRADQAPQMAVMKCSERVLDLIWSKLNITEKAKLLEGVL